MADRIEIDVVANDKASAELKGVSKSVEGIRKEVEKISFERVVSSAQQLGATFKQVGAQITSTLSTIMTDAAKYNDGLKEEFQSESLVAYSEAVDEFNTALEQLKLTLSEAFAPELTRILTEELIPAITSLIQWFNSLDESTRNNIVRWVIFTGVASTVIGSLLQLFATLGQAKIALDAFGLALPGVSANIGGVIAGLKTFAVALGTTLPHIALLIGALLLLKVAWDNFGQAAMTAAGQLLYIIGYHIVQAIQGIVNFGATLVSLVTSLPQQLAGIGAQFAEVGIQIVQGIWEGIQDGWDWLIEQVQQLAEDLLEAAKDALDISSPSKAFAAQVGKPIVQGVGVGMSQAMPALQSQVSSSFGSLPAGMGAQPVNNYGGGFTLVYSPGVSMATADEIEANILPYIRSANREIGR